MNKLNIFVRIFIVLFLLFVATASHHTNFYLTFLLLNIVLAYIPFEISNLLLKFNNKFIIILLAFLWLLFYPNSPYLLTDFFHLEALNIYEFTTPFNFVLKDWFVFSIMTCGILFGFIIGIISLFRVINKLQKTFIKNFSFIKTFILIIVVTFIAGFAIYLGRFPRLHSYYLFIEPQLIFSLIVQSINSKSICFSLAMASWQTVIIYLLKLFKNDKNEL